MGSIGRPHGLRGEVLVRLTTNRLERVAVGAVLHAGDRRLVVAEARPHQQAHLVRFEGVTDREAAEALRGSLLSAEPIDDPDTLWVHDLVGRPVREVDGTDRGRIEAVQANPASDLLVTTDGALVPLVFYVEQRDGVVIIDPPRGLFDADSDEG